MPHKLSLLQKELQMSVSSLATAERSAPTEGDMKQEYRNAMARLGAAVHIVTTDGPGGLGGFAATAVCSVTDSPPTLLVCLNRTSSAHPAVSTNGVVCVNILESGHAELSRIFGGKTPVKERFDSASWSQLATGAPVLDDALVSFDCRITTVCDGGTHDILICEVVAIRENEGGRALIYFDRGYHAL